MFKKISINLYIDNAILLEYNAIRICNMISQIYYINFKLNFTKKT